MILSFECWILTKLFHSSFTFIKWKWSRSVVSDSAIPWTVAHQAPPSMRFSRQEYWSGLPFPSLGESSRPRDRTQVSCIAGRCFNVWATREALYNFSSLSAIEGWCHLHIWSYWYFFFFFKLLIFLLAVLIPTCASYSMVFIMMYSAYKLNKQGDGIQPWHSPFPIWNSPLFHVWF